MNLKSLVDIISGISSLYINDRKDLYFDLSIKAYELKLNENYKDLLQREIDNMFINENYEMVIWLKQG